jgi:hypothetical protein
MTKGHLIQNQIIYRQILVGRIKDIKNGCITLY